MAVTISEIAKMAKVSQSTVSRVLNSSGYVKEETRERVQKVIKELNYTPSAIARS
uniref:LacI family DNA-binding transcriptional regulator n=1 Tax=uncultured Clostridium sp. TaxID=59620 RepID=UPI0025F22833